MNRVSFISFMTGALLLFFWNLGSVPFFDPDEGRYADIALTMLKTGDLLTPRMNYIPHLHKPPLANWLVVLAFKALGPSEFSARLPSVLLSLVLLLCLIRLGTFLFDSSAGLAGAWILLTSTLYLATSRLVTTDMALTFLTFLGMFSFAHLFFEKKHTLFYFYLAVLSLSLGMLTKGPVAWMICLLPGVCFALWKRKKLPIAMTHWILGGILFVGISLSWFILSVLQNHETFDYFFRQQLIGRMFQGKMGRAHPFYYYFAVLPLGFLPWSIFMPRAAAWLFAKKNLSDEDRQRCGFLAAYFLIPFIFFSLFRTKLATYIVPLFPPLALLAGRFWSDFQKGRIPRGRFLAASSWLMALFPLLLGVTGTVFINVRPKFVAGIPQAAVAALQVFLLASTIMHVMILTKDKAQWLFRSQIIFLMIVCVFALSVLPSIEFKNIKVFTNKILELKKPGDVVLMSRRYFASFPFYLGQRIICVGLPRGTFDVLSESEKQYVFSDRSALENFLKGPSRAFVLTNDDGYREEVPRINVPVYPLLQRGGLVLYSNRES